MAMNAGSANNMHAQNMQARVELMRHHFNAAVCKELGVSDRYQQISVLLVRWAEQLDTDLRCTKETAELEKVFRETFGFTTRAVALECQQKKPEGQLNHHVASFVNDYDGDHRNTLLIVYYSGHGFLDKIEGEDQFFILGKQDPMDTSEFGQTPHIPRANWKNADSCLQSADADVLTIMDCCYAANLMKSDGNNTRTFETLAATNFMTPMPGPSSYTNALIETLKVEAAKYRANEPYSFDTFHLHVRICERLGSRSPRLVNRLQSSINRHIRLGPLEASQKPTTPQPAQTNRCMSSLRLQIDFAKAILTNDETTRLAQHLAKVAKQEDLPITGLDMLEFAPKAGQHIRSMVGVTMLLQAAMNKRSEKSKKRLRSSEKGDSEPEKRQQRVIGDLVDSSLTPPSSSRDNTPSRLPG